MLQAQYPNGAWPQRFPLRFEFAHHGFPDYTANFTLNDGVMIGNIDLLIVAYQTLGDPRYFEAARRAVDFLIAVQGPADQAAWAERYGPDGEPIAARTHEPAGYVIRESRDTITLLEMFYTLTGHRRYLRPIPACLEWFARVNREALASKRPPARYWEPGTNLPIYVVRTNETTPDGYGIVRWTTKAPTPGMRCWSGPCETDVREIVDIAPIRREYEEVAALATPDARKDYYHRHFERRTSARGALPSVSEVITSLDARGAWVDDRLMVLRVVERGFSRDDKVLIRGISMDTFVRNLGVLTDQVRNTR